MEDQYRHLVNFFEEHEIGHQGQNDDVPSLDNIIQQLAGDKEATVKSVKYSIGSVKDQYAQRIAKKTLQDKATSKIKGKHGLALRRYMKDFVKEKGLQVVDPNSFYMRAGSLDHALQMRNELKGQYQDNQKMKQLGLKYEPPKEEKKK